MTKLKLRYYLQSIDLLKIKIHSNKSYIGNQEVKIISGNKANSQLDALNKLRILNQKFLRLQSLSFKLRFKENHLLSSLYHHQRGFQFQLLLHPHNSWVRGPLLFLSLVYKDIQ